MSRVFDKVRHVGLLTETVVALFGARIILAVFSFQQLTWFFERPIRQRELTGAGRATARRQVRNAIYFAKHKIFRDNTTCFHHAIAAHAMLRRRGISTTLYYGAARRPSDLGLPERELATHVWLQDGAYGIVGNLTAQMEQFQILARYPAEKGL